MEIAARLAHIWEKMSYSLNSRWKKKPLSESSTKLVKDLKSDKRACAAQQEW